MFEVSLCLCSVLLWRIDRSETICNLHAFSVFMAKSIDERAEFSKCRRCVLSLLLSSKPQAMILFKTRFQSIVQSLQWKRTHVIPFDPNELPNCSICWLCTAYEVPTFECCRHHRRRRLESISFRAKNIQRWQFTRQTHIHVLAWSLMVNSFRLFPATASHWKTFPPTNGANSIELMDGIVLYVAAQCHCRIQYKIGGWKRDSMCR